MRLFEDFYFRRANLERINWASIALIPKIDTPELLGDYWPISLINSSLKILSKLGKVLSHLVNFDQSAFLKGMHLDNITNAEELIFSIHKMVGLYSEYLVLL